MANNRQYAFESNLSGTTSIQEEEEAQRDKPYAHAHVLVSYR